MQELDWGSSAWISWDWRHAHPQNQPCFGRAWSYFLPTTWNLPTSVVITTLQKLPDWVFSAMLPSTHSGWKDSVEKYSQSVPSQTLAQTRNKPLLPHPLIPDGTSTSWLLYLPAQHSESQAQLWFHKTKPYIWECVYVCVCARVHVPARTGGAERAGATEPASQST